MGTPRDNAPAREQAFDVVMLKNGSNEVTAAAKDFRLVTVMATDPVQAMRTVRDYHVYCVLSIGAKLRARRRAA